MKIALIAVLLLLLCGVAVCAESQPPIPGSREKVEQPYHKTQKEKEPSDQLNACAESLATINKLLNAQGQEKTAGKNTPPHKEESSAKWWGTPDIWVAIFTGILAAITGALAYFTLMLWRATKTMVDEASLTSKRQAAETEAALEISRNAANAAMEQAKTASETLQRSNRAWIGLMGKVEIVTPLSFDENGATCKIRLTIKNVGKSPAVNTCSICNLIVVPFPPRDPRDFAAVIDESILRTITNNMGITVIPGDPLPWGVNEVKGTMTEKLSEVSVWLNGYFGYKDEFGTLHSSSFLFYFVTSDGEKKIPTNKTVKGQFERFGAGWINT